MKKLEEIINKYVPPHCQGSWYKEMMIEYAVLCLEKAAEEAQIRMECTLSFGKPSVYYVKETEQNNYNLSIDKQSINDIELP